MTRPEIIEKAKRMLPPFEDNIQQLIMIPVKEGDLTHYVEFERCSVGKTVIIRNDWGLMEEDYRLAWIPIEYLTGIRVGGFKSFENEESELLLKEYLIP